jgi:CRISPR-associated protein Cas8c/Csd1 subtype I-C
MLAELYQFSKQLQLPPVGYSTNTAVYSIDLETGLISLLQTKIIKTGKKEDKVFFNPGEKLILPNLNRNGVSPLLIADTGEYLFGIGSNKDTDKKVSGYLALLQECWNVTSDPVLEKVLKFIQESSQESIISQLETLGNKPPKGKKPGESERFVFYYQNPETEQSELVTNRPLIQEFWSKYFLSKQITNPGKCIITGQETQVLTHILPGKLKGIPGGQSTGSAISSFDKSAYQSWGWKKCQNAPIGIDTALGFLGGVEMLQSNPRHHHKFGNQMFVFWGDQNQEGINPEFWQDVSACRLKGLIQGINTGKNLDTRHYSKKFYLGILKGNIGRVAINRIDSISPDEIANNVEQFCQLQQWFDNWTKPIWVFRKAAFFDINKEHTEVVDTALIQFALLGKELPQIYAKKVIDRICAEQDTFESFDRAKALFFYTKHPNMNDPNDLIAYQLGRITFLMHWAQMKARKQTKEDTNVTRSLKTLSTTPSQVFGRLYQGCYAHHFLEEETKYIKLLLDEEFRMVSPEDLPDNFTLRQQSLFFVGFAKKRAEFFTRKSDKNKDQDPNNNEEE